MYKVKFKYFQSVRKTLKDIIAEKKLSSKITYPDITVDLADLRATWVNSWCNNGVQEVVA